MTEREKMMQGLLYDANFDPELLRQRTECKELCYDYNHTRPSDDTKRTEILKRLFKTTGERLTIEQPFVCDYGYNIIHLSQVIISREGTKSAKGYGLQRTGLRTARDCLNIFVIANCGA